MVYGLCNKDWSSATALKVWIVYTLGNKSLLQNKDCSWTSFFWSLAHELILVKKKKSNKLSCRCKITEHIIININIKRKPSFVNDSQMWIKY